MREMEMKNPQSDGNESVIDIFVLGRSETGTLELIGQLEGQDYQVTLFNDGTQLIDTLHSGKPNLIICDTTSFGQEAYECCRQIKSDDRLWMIPVMILTPASSVGDLLNVLDSNADNFIAHPCDSPYLLSLIEEMLLTPVERQTPELIKTQFKIQHDDRVFVVTADRRKLLEFLMSAFEIAAKKSEDLAAANAELQALSSRLTTTENAGLENIRLIGTLNAGIRKKEQDERTLKGDLEKSGQALDEKTQEASQLSRDLEDARALLSTAEEQIRILLAEKEKSDLAYQSEISLLAGQGSSLSQALTEKTAELNAAQQARERETTRSGQLDLAVKEYSAQAEELKANLQALTLEHEQQASALAAEKNRAQVAEDEARSTLQAKEQSEQELVRLCEERKEIARQQDDEILRLKTGLEAETTRRTSAEAQLETLRQEWEQSKAAQEIARESQQRQIDELQEKNDAAVATLFSQERELKILRDELVVARTTGEKSAATAASVTAAFNETRVEIEERVWKIQSLEKQIADIKIQKETSDEKIRDLTALLESVQSALNTEKEQHATAKERLQAAIRERDENLQSVRSEHDQTKTDLDVHKNDLVRLHRDLEAAALLRSTLQGDIATASSRIKELEYELKSAAQEKDRTGQQARLLTEELGAIKAALNEARASLSLEKEQRIAAEDQLKTALEQERMLQAAAVENARAATQAKNTADNEDTSEATIQALKNDFEQALARQRMLEQEVKTLGSQKAEAEARAEALSNEIDQARTALADEWEDHMNDEERLAASRNQAVIINPAGLPVEVRPAVQAVVVTTPPASPEGAMPRTIPKSLPDEAPIFRIEDLFEDDPSGPVATDQPSVILQPPVPEPSAETPDGIMDDAPAQEPDFFDEPESGQDSIDKEDEPDETDEDAGEDAGDERETLDDFIKTPSGHGISFNRQQWFDLLKWSHHSGALSQEQRMQIVRMGRLIQRGRKLTPKQDEQVREMLVLVQTLGYQLH